MLAKYYLKQQYQLSINDMYKLRRKKENASVSIWLRWQGRQAAQIE